MLPKKHMIIQKQSIFASVHTLAEQKKKKKAQKLHSVAESPHKCNYKTVLEHFPVK